MTILEKFTQRIHDVQRILITTHEYPDADGIGSQISLCLGLRTLGKDVWCVNDVKLLDRYNYLDPQNVVLGLKQYQAQLPDFAPELIIVVDTNKIERVGGTLSQYLSGHSNILYLDHHPSRDADRSDHCLDTSAAATGQIVGEILLHLDIQLTQEMALPIYTAIVIDTSSFRYPTVTAKTHRLIAKLLDTGFSASEAYNGIYGTKKVSHMHLLATILKTAQVNSKENIAWIHFSHDDIKNFISDVEDTHAFINHLLILDHIKIAAMFRDDGDVLKMSLRSSGEIDVGAIAKELGGGGHSHSAASIFDKSGKKAQQIIQETITKIEGILEKHSSQS